MLDTEDEAYPPSMSMSIDENENDNTSKQPSSKEFFDMKLMHMHEMQSNNGFENTSVNSPLSEAEAEAVMITPADPDASSAAGLSQQAFPTERVAHG
jgi:hypothetical protein